MMYPTGEKKLQARRPIWVYKKTVKGLGRYFKLSEPLFHTPTDIFIQNRKCIKKSGWYDPGNYLWLQVRDAKRMRIVYAHKNKWCVMPWTTKVDKIKAHVIAVKLGGI